MDENERRRLLHERHRLQTEEARRREERREQIRADERQRKRDQEREKLEARQHELQQKQDGELDKLHTQHALQPEALQNAFEDQKRRDYLRHMLAEFSKNSDLERDKELISHEREWNLVEAAFLAKLQGKERAKDISEEDLKWLVKEVMNDIR